MLGSKPTQQRGVKMSGKIFVGAGPGAVAVAGVTLGLDL
jgi:hypothetical protein